MKNASKHAATLKSLCKRLMKQHKAPERPQAEPLRALVLGALSENCDDARVAAAVARFDEEFVDINELRVATELELADLMGEDYPHVGERSVRLREMLMSLFDAEGRLNVDRIAALNKKEQRQRLKSVPLITPFIEAYMSAIGFGQAAVPVDETMRTYLEAEEAIAEESDLEETQKFLEGQLKADECWPFFFACREAALEAHAATAKSAARKSPKKAKVPKKTTRKSA